MLRAAFVRIREESKRNRCDKLLSRYRKKSGGKAALIMTRPQTLKAVMPENPVVHVSRAG